MHAMYSKIRKETEGVPKEEKEKKEKEELGRSWQR